ncbi:MAG: pyruvate:ferredoxin (flavodoxin) oxidoreductase [Spirochaetaceae bacterium]|jgi:pyruvate-ferredoxin/flavodoxin oxidoreductase|nr:pyruvate:ferredoxin (flavodoxin) oxidoreductase [Spirochaetaceae bacterium]
MSKKPKQEVMDGNTAAAYISYAFTEVASIYPITPSSPMAEMIDEWSAGGRKNIFGAPVIVKEMQSEGGAAGALHGALQGGALASTYTASQGLLLMIPNIYKIVGELLPGVFHISARSLASNALSIFGDHQDVMAIRQTGISMIASSSVQECIDLGAVAHLSAIKSRIAVAHFFDGFRTSHEYQKVDLIDYEDIKKAVDWKAIQAFRERALNPAHPVLRGTTQNPDTFFQTRESVNPFYTNLADLIQSQMDVVNKLTGRDYKLFNYYGPARPEKLIIAMGSACEVIKEALDYANGKPKAKTGLIQVRLFRPFAADKLLASIPRSVQTITVLDRTKEPGAAGEPLYTEVRNAFYGASFSPKIIGGRYGLASKDFTPVDVFTVIENMAAKKPRDGFTVGITDDVTNLSLTPSADKTDTAPAGTTACKFWGFGSDGTVGANKSAVKIIGDHTSMYTQAYFVYDAKKSGGITVSHVRFGKTPIRSSYLVTSADFIACHNQTYVTLYDLLEGIKEGGIFLLSCTWSADEVHKHLPKKMVKELIDKKVKFYVINAVDIAKKIGLGGRINMVMQAAFFALTKILPPREAAKYLKEEVESSYGRAGQKVVDMNCRAIDRGFDSIVQVNLKPSAVAGALSAPPAEKNLPKYVVKVQKVINAQKGDLLPVSVFKDVEDGSFPTGTTKYEKRGVALEVPLWDAEKCIQCNRCSFVCPHSVLRPTLLTPEQLEAAPPSLTHKKAQGIEGREFTMGFSALDCQGCGNCVQICPAREKALTMVEREPRDGDFAANWAYIEKLPKDVPQSVNTGSVKGSQFLRPYFEFPCSCAGCGETPYARLITQLFGSRMMISNSAGCATVWGGNTPSVPYTKDDKGRGPAWDFSLFEDNAEFGYGMSVGARTVRNLAAEKLRAALPSVTDEALAKAASDFLDRFNTSEGTWERADALEAALAPHKADRVLGEIYRLKDYFAKRSFWVFGGDGWAYDIGYGGLDHVLASGEDINIMVFDTEVYSNTGGQSSKATPAGATAKFAMAGKQTAKKDLGRLAMTYGYVYVAQIAMGASMDQTIKAVIEAEAYPGPSLIIGYAPCINHGITSGMGTTQLQEKKAVECGYWSLWRYNPALKAEGKNPFTLDSPEPTADFREFLMSEVRYSALMKSNPEAAGRLFEKTKSDALNRIAVYKNLHEKSF